MRAFLAASAVSLLIGSNATYGADELSLLTDGSQWWYRHSQDEMSGKTGEIACTSSTNELQFDFPYAGGSVGQLCLRKGPQFGNDVYVTISKGQMICLAGIGCSVRVRFDDGVPFTVDGNGTSDGRADVAFLHGYAGLVIKMKRAKAMLVELQFF